jgi:DNA-binding MarR family transcriptional regulator
MNIGIDSRIRSDKQLRQLSHALEAFRVLDPEIQAQMVLTFLYVASAPPNEPISMRELQNKLGIASSSTSRNISALSAENRVGEPGHDLVEKREDPNDRRNNLVRLTAKGRTFAARITDLLK